MVAMETYPLLLRECAAGFGISSDTKCIESAAVDDCYPYPAQGISFN